MPEVRTHEPTPSAHRELLEVLPRAPTDKPPLLFVHGAWHGAWCFREHWMPEAAARGWPCYAVSLRGHGGSHGRDDLGTTPLGRFEQDVLETIAQLHEAPVLIGHSMGGLITQRIAASEPRVPAAVLVASVPPRHHLGAVGQLLRHDPRALARALVGAEPGFRPRTLYGPATDEETAARLTARTGPESLVATHQLVLPRGAATPTCPTLVLGGGDDRLVAPHAVVRTARALGTQARLFRGLGHNLMLEDAWEAPLDVLLEWLERTLAR